MLKGQTEEQHKKQGQENSEYLSIQLSALMLTEYALDALAFFCCLYSL